MSDFVAKIPPGEIDTLYASQGHLSARGQKLVSEIVLDYFRRQGWLPE